MAPAATPVRPVNPAGLARIQYRIGTFPTFRQAMLDDLAAWMPEVRVGSATPGYATALLELWAYIADVLTFYQEQIANEAYIGTATQRRSLFRLAELIAYRPRPGASASAMLAFAIAPGRTVAIPQGLRTGNKPAAGQPAATFETDVAILARAEHNRIPIATTAPSNQFAPLSAITNVFAKPLPVFTSRSDLDQFRADLTTVFGSLGGDVFQSIGLQYQSSASGSASRRVPPATSRTVAFRGTNLKIRQGDYLLILDRVDASGNPRGPGALREVTRVLEDRPSRTTRLTWVERQSYTYARPDPLVLVFHTRAAPFGANAPDFRLLSPFLNATSPMTFTPFNPVFRKDWGTITLPDTTDNNVLDLDRAYDTVVPSTPGAESWAVLLDGRTSEHHARQITAVSQKTRSDYTLTARVTELTLDGPINRGTPAPPAFYLKTTTVLIQSQRLTLANDRQLPEPIGGATLILGGAYPQLAIGQPIVITGQAYDATSGRARAQAVTQDAVIDDLRTGTPPSTGLTVLTLRQPLGDTYTRSTTSVIGNVAPGSHGESVRDEVLGSGDGHAWQRFALRKHPLTYVVSSTTETALASTLQVTVNGVRWTECADLVDAGPQDRVFSTGQDESNATTVQFGDGLNGARPPTGKDSIHARYRFGIGVSGDVAAGAITRLIDSIPGLQSVSNPEPTSGGADPESNLAIRVNAPASLRTYGRAVSIEDYAALAMTFPGVARARAAWVRRDDQGRMLAHPAIYLAVGTANALPLTQQTDYAARLRRFLDSHRDPNVPMRLVDAGRVYVDVAAVIDVEDAYGRHATLAAARAALYPGTNPDGSTGFFGRLDFGDAVHLSAVYAALQAVRGVRAAQVTTLRLPRPDPPDRPAPDAEGTVRDHIFVRPSAVAFVANDPSDVANLYGKVAVDLGIGGFTD